MAKRVSPEEKPWNPVEDQLARDALKPEGATTVPLPASVAHSSPRAVDTKSPPETPPAETKVEVKDAGKDPDAEEPKAVDSLCREKRVLLTENEEDTLERLVKDMGKRLGTPLKLSHVLRATTSLLMHSQDELLKQSEKIGRLKRPPNNDPVGLATFEHNLARIIDRAIRGSRVLD